MAIRKWARTFAGGTLAAQMARLNARHPWNHNDHFHSWILANLTTGRDTALDVGCGQGELLSRLAPHFTTVHGSDIDIRMREQSAQRCAGIANVAIHDGDWSDLPGPFDLVTMIAVLHHLDIASALHDVRARLAPGGRFLAVGLAPPNSAVDYAWDVASIVTNPIIGFVKHPWPSPDGPQPPSVPIKDPTMTFDELRACVDAVMPGAVMKHHLGFRHTIAWTKSGK